MAHPQIAAFARLAEGNARPNRKIEGQKTLLSRTMHALAYDSIHDEIVVPQPIPQNILTFRGQARGEEPPLRIIQGSLTQLGHADKLAIDPVNNEILVPQGEAVLVFPREANGNVAPIRILKGPDAFREAAQIAVDPVANLLFVSGETADGKDGVTIFDRTAQGNAKPRGVIYGPSGHILTYPEKGLLIAVTSVPRHESSPSLRDENLANNRGYVGVWSIHDRGLVPARWMIGGPDGLLLQIRGVALDPKNGTVMISDKRLNSLLTYSFPEIF